VSEARACLTCGKPAKGKGSYCSQACQQKTYRIRHGQGIGMQAGPLPYSPRQIARFWRHVDQRGPDECWPWLLGRTTDGYGRVRLDGMKLRAHRIAYLAAKGPISNGLLVCHACDNPPCCNPAHLWLGTVLDNTRDAQRKGRLVPPPHNGRIQPTPPSPQFGVSNGAAKLTEESVRAMRADYRSMGSYASVARRYSISVSQGYRVITGQYWSHVK